jgi:hypothetical protein
MATTHTHVAATTNNVARKYLAGMIKISASGRSNTPTALKKPMACAQHSPRFIGPAQ